MEELGTSGHGVIGTSGNHTTPSSVVFSSLGKLYSGRQFGGGSSTLQLVFYKGIQPAF